jgi:hypothetical protein
MKTRGFDLERSAMTFADRLERLFGLVTLAWVCCLRVGIWRHALKPIAVKAHGRRAVSVVSYGWEYLVQAIRWEETLAETYFGLLRYWYSVDFFKIRVLYAISIFLTNCLHMRAGQHYESESTEYQYPFPAPGAA